ncbi:uncharacterized protein HfgLR_21010 (plasmid) [Haloferax gibbonsii]|uniref:Uncharacterized protein n=1 Tax=Haloferax gibbonsii TaxID=35746 RepID=A0A871BJY0_HALGI|nr:uncharacterized protein HfgLR_21010 [Haloferax gibbonsii]
MQTVPSSTIHFGLSILCGIAGFVLRGTEGAVLGALIGYFLGKLLQSIFWMLTGNHPT